jgi:hypothetical protein
MCVEMWQLVQNLPPINTGLIPKSAHFIPVSCNIYYTEKKMLSPAVNVGIAMYLRAEYTS